MYTIKKVIDFAKKQFFPKNKYKLSILEKILFRIRPIKEINTYAINGKTIKYNFAPYWFKHSYEEIFIESVYKFAEPSQLPYKIIDCGSNIGLSVIYYKLMYPNSRITGFEADPITFNILKENVQTFVFNDVSLFQKAVWVHEEGIKFTPNGMGGCIVQEQDTHNQPSISIETIRLRTLITERIDFLKIDIEGAEIEVLQDCADLLTYVDKIFIEYHCYKGQALQLELLLQILTASKFRYYIRQAYENMENPFIEKTGAFMDMQLNIFCFR